MSLRIKAVVENFVRDLKAALDADIQDGIMKEREMNSYLEEREREVAEREAAWKADLSRREVRLPPWLSTFELAWFLSVCRREKRMLSSCFGDWGCCM
jgi:hypothetical protein